MRITRQELLKIRDDDESPSRYLCVEFSPWQYEDYNDVKVALMTTVLDAVGTRTGGGDQQEQVSKLRKFAQGLGRWGRRSGRVAVSATQTAAPFAIQAMDPGNGSQHGSPSSGCHKGRGERGSVRGEEAAGRPHGQACRIRQRYGRRDRGCWAVPGRVRGRVSRPH